MMSNEERVWLYFERAVQQVSEKRIIEEVIEELRNMHPNVNGLELINHNHGDCETCMDSLEERTLKVMDNV